MIPGAGQNAQVQDHQPRRRPGLDAADAAVGIEGVVIKGLDTRTGRPHRRLAESAADDRHRRGRDRGDRPDRAPRGNTAGRPDAEGERYPIGLSLPLKPPALRATVGEYLTATGDTRVRLPSSMFGHTAANTNPCGHARGQSRHRTHRRRLHQPSPLRLHPRIRPTSTPTTCPPCNPCP
jgi:hypothetical protein